MPKGATLDIVAAADTIAAIATAPGVGAIGIVRVSGPSAVSVAAACFQSKHGSLDCLASHQLHHGHWVDPQNGQVVDEVLLAVMPGPGSYTGEDVVEVYGHGGPLVLQELLRTALLAGARPAQAGEFTLRAFRNGRMDLLQAEAVADLIEARTVSARRLALRALGGGLSERVTKMKARVLELLAHLETHLEFPMEDVEPMPEDELLEALGGLGRQVEQLLGMAERRGIYRRGLFTVITGRPNVGKSLLFNRVLGRERALVTEHPGTTRDTVEETVRLGGVELHLVDTAGGREMGGHIEQLGVQRAMEAVGQADLVWFLIDAGAGVTGEDEQWLRQILDRVGEDTARLLLVINKIDLVESNPAIEAPVLDRVFPEEQRSFVSAKTGEGLEAFWARVERLAVRQGGVDDESDLMVNRRHEHLLEGMREAFRRIEEAVASDLSLDVVAGDLWDVKAALDQLDGTRVSGDLLGEIFSRFCIGK